MSVPPSDPAAATPGAPSRPRWTATPLVPLTNLAILLGALLTVLGAFGPSWEELGGGLALLLGGVVLFFLEGKLTRAWVGVDTGRPKPTLKDPPWWKWPISYHGRWLCTSCGWREEKATTFCPRCGKVLVRLPAPPTDKT